MGVNVTMTLAALSQIIKTPVHTKIDVPICIMFVPTHSMWYYHTYTIISENKCRQRVPAKAYKTQEKLYKKKKRKENTFWKNWGKNSSSVSSFPGVHPHASMPQYWIHCTQISGSHGDAHWAKGPWANVSLMWAQGPFAYQAIFFTSQFSTTAQSLGMTLWLQDSMVYWGWYG